MKTILTAIAAAGLAGFAGAANAAETRGVVEDYSNMDDRLVLESGEAFIMPEGYTQPDLEDGADVTVTWTETDDGTRVKFVIVHESPAKMAE